MAAIASWHRVLRYGALTFGIAHGSYAFDQLSVIRAAERKEEIGNKHMLIFIFLHLETFRGR